jgi:hypothetical protein
LSPQQTRAAVAALPRAYSSFLVHCYSRPCFKRLANFDQPIVNHDPKFNTAPRLETTHEICASASAALEQDKEVDQLCAILKEPDGEQHVLSAALQMINTAADAEIGIMSLVFPCPWSSGLPAECMSLVL